MVYRKNWQKMCSSFRNVHMLFSRQYQPRFIFPFRPRYQPANFRLVEFQCIILSLSNKQLCLSEFKTFWYISMNVYHRRYMYHIVICVKFGRKLMVKVWNKRSTWIYNFSFLFSNEMFQTHIHFRIIIKIFLIMYECTNVNRKV